MIPVLVHPLRAKSLLRGLPRAQKAFAGAPRIQMSATLTGESRGEGAHPRTLIPNATRKTPLGINRSFIRTIHSVALGSVLRHRP